MRIHGGDIWWSDKSLIDYSSNLNCFISYKKILKALKSMPDSYFTSHPSVYPYQLERAIEKFLDLEGCVVVLPGSIYGIHLLIEGIRPKRVVVPVPTFNEYERVARLHNVKVHRFFLKEEESFRLCLGEFASEVEEGDLIFVCNPNNPTGGLFGLEEMKGLLRWTQSKNAWVVFDEAFIDFTEMKNTEKLVLSNENIFILRSFTKIFSVPGIRVGYMMVNSVIRDRLRDLVPSWCVPRFAEELAFNLLGEYKNLDVVRRVINREKIFLYKRLEDLGFKAFPSYTNFIFLKVPHNFKASVLKRYLLERGFLIRDFPEYEFLEDRFFRISVRKRSDNIKLIKALDEAVHEGV